MRWLTRVVPSLETLTRWDQRLDWLGWWAVRLALAWLVLFWLAVALCVLAEAQPAPNPRLTALPPGQALDLGVYTCTARSGNFPDCGGVTSYSGMQYDASKGRMLLFGGGHADSALNAVDTLPMDTLTWQYASPITPCAQQIPSTLDMVRGAWPDGNPIARHTYDLNVVTPTHLIVMGAQPNFNMSCGAPPPGVNEYANGSVVLWNLSTGQWEYDTNTPYFASGYAASYDPPSGKVILVSAGDLWTYDPGARKATKQLTFGPYAAMVYAQNLVYYPPTDRHYYVVSLGHVYEVTLDRQAWSKSTVAQVQGITGDIPSSPETGWGYDSANHVIGGGVKDGVFYAYQPESKRWTKQVMQGATPPQLGNVSFHALDYDPVNGVFVWISSTGHTWAYRASSVALPPSTPAGSLPIGDLSHDGPPTPEQLSLFLPMTGTLPQTATATVRYRLANVGAWQTGHPLYRIRPQFSETPAIGSVPDAFAWPVIDLTPGTTYDVEVTVSDGTLSVVKAGTFTTRALPPPSGPATKVIAAGATYAQISAVLASIVPGDVIEFAEGTFPLGYQKLTRGGTATQPVTIRGVSRDKTILDAGTGIAFSLTLVGYLTFEHFTLQGSGVDSGENAYSVGVAMWNGDPTATYAGITVRHVTMRGVDQAFACAAAPHGCTGALLYDNTFLGNNRWASSFIDTHATWNDDGVNLAGSGNVAFQNTIQGFGDCISYAQHSGSSTLTINIGNHAYRNDLRNCGDDLTEVDHAFRNNTFYDNRSHNSMTALSLDPLYGGPFLYARNIVINTGRTPFKWNSTQSGQFLYNNTIVRTTGAYQFTLPGAEAAWYQAGNGVQDAYGYQNNILVYRGVGNPATQVIVLGMMPPTTVDFSYNAWYPDGDFSWFDVHATPLKFLRDAIKANTRWDTAPVFSGSHKRHEADVITVSNPWTQPVVLGPNYLTEVTGTYTPVLAPGTTPKNSGTVILGVTDGYTGSAPDRGAIIDGRPLPTWGDQSGAGQPPVPVFRGTVKVTVQPQP